MKMENETEPAIVYLDVAIKEYNSLTDLPLEDK
jgi:hypothetical protein